MENDKFFINHEGVCFILNSLTVIPMYAFAGCTSLESIVIPDSVSKIGCGAFNSCINLKKIRFPRSLYEIQLAAFHNCTSLKSVIIPEVYDIDGSFYGCTSLESVYLGGVRFINNSSFEKCPSLKDIHLKIKNLDGVHISCNAFDAVSKSQGTLYVPASCIQACRQHEELGQFKNIEIEESQF